MRTDPGSGGHIMFPDFCQSVLLAFGQRTHISHDHHSRGQCCSSASISYDVPCMGVISYQKTFASALRSSMVSAEVAEACFQQAIAIARRQGAMAWELRAAISLGRLWQCQGKLGEAQQLLAGVYGWFTEGFDTVDLQAAQVLLQESSG